MHYNKAGLFMLLFCVFGSFVWFLWLLYGGMSLDLGEVSPPTSNLAQNTAQNTAEKYWLSTPSLVAQGKKAYLTYCATCHGVKALGDGVAGKGLKPVPRNLVQGDWQKGGSSIELYQTLAKGITGSAMASFSYLPKNTRWALVHYIRSITQNKVKDDLKKLEAFAQKTK